VKFVVALVREIVEPDFGSPDRAIKLPGAELAEDAVVGELLAGRRIS